MQEDNQSSLAETLLQTGAKIQRLYDVLRERADVLKEWRPENEEEERLKQAEENLVYGLMDDFCDYFDNILARRSC